MTAKAKTSEALLEIGTEPVPARFLRGALHQLETGAKKLLAEHRLAFGAVRALGTPRRLALRIDGVPPKSETLTRTVTGPPAKLLKDEQGRFTKQAAGFAKAQGVEPEALQVAESPRGELLCAVKKIPGRPAADILSEAFAGLIAALQFPKSMRWEETDFRFARPIRTLAALYGKRVVKLEAAGVKAGRLSPGLSEFDKPVSIPAAADYEKALAARCVVVDPAERRAELEKALGKCAKSAGLELDLDAALLEETVCLTEHPVPLVGSFREAFLELPADLITTTLKKQLKAFPLREKGAVAPKFVPVRDGLSENMKEVREGFERVVEARLDDALFFYERDKRVPLTEMRAKLEGTLFHEALGSMLDKSERLRRLTAHLCRAIDGRAIDAKDADTVAELAYADLASEVIGEFPELQGRMGGAYARLEGRPERVALGLEEFYRPEGGGGPLPSTDEGSLASLAGKLDTIAGGFAVGQAPSGSADPHGLRRQAIGAWRIALERGLPIDLSAAIAEAVELQPKKGEGLAAKIEEFLWQRAEAFLLDAGYATDEIRAVREGALRDVPRTVNRLAALKAARKRPEFASLAAAYKRAANILKKSGSGLNGEVRPELFEHDAEKALLESLDETEARVRAKLDGGEFEESLKIMVGLKPAVDGFFDEVLVNAEDERVRVNRFTLLSRLVRLFKSVADLSQLQG